VLLEAANFRVVEAETAGRATVEARAHKPDLLLLDLGLPDGDGITVIRGVREWSPVPIVVLSWRANPDEETTDWKAVRGRTAHTVRRAGRALGLPDRYRRSHRQKIPTRLEGVGIFCLWGDLLA
jgi:CheY-like chemotaxis protein